jgi:hypothetical protein
MTSVPTTTQTELAQRSSAGIDVRLVWVDSGGADDVLVCVCDRREGVYFEIPAEPHLASTPTTTPLLTASSAPSTPRTAYSRRSPHRKEH